MITITIVSEGETFRDISNTLDDISDHVVFGVAHHTTPHYTYRITQGDKEHQTQADHQAAVVDHDPHYGRRIDNNDFIDSEEN